MSLSVIVTMPGYLHSMDIPVSAMATAARARTLAILEKNILANVGIWVWFILEDAVLMGGVVEKCSAKREML